MRSESIVLKGLVLLAVLFMLSAPNVLAVECAADIDCDGEVGLFDLILMKNEYGTSGCTYRTACPEDIEKCSNCYYSDDCLGCQGDCCCHILGGPRYINVCLHRPFCTLLFAGTCND